MSELITEANFGTMIFCFRITIHLLLKVRLGQLIVQIEIVE